MQGMRVLVVDDNLTNGCILDKMLASWGIKPTLEKGGEGALRALGRGLEAQEPFPLVLTDANMPGMDGFELANAIRKDPRMCRRPT